MPRVLWDSLRWYSSLVVVAWQSWSHQYNTLKQAQTTDIWLTQSHTVVLSHSHPKLPFYLLPPVHGTSREKTPKKQFELLPCSWDCLSVPYLHVVQLNIWLVWVVSLWIAVPTFPLPHFPCFVRAATRLIIFCLFQLSYSGWSLNCFLDYISCYLHWMETMCGSMKQREWQLYLFMVCIFQKKRIEIALFSSNVEINRPFLKVSY